VQRGKLRGKATRNTTLTFGEFGLQALESGQLTAQQIEAARTAITRHLHRRGRVWIKVFPDKPYTKKPLEVRMGKGKGNPEGWTAPILPGNIIFELSGCPETLAKAALTRAAAKVPMRCKFVSRQTA